MCKNLKFKTAGKFILLLSLVSLFSTACVIKVDKKESTETKTRPKIQKNNSYQPACGILKGYSVKCSKGQPSCGSKPGEYLLKLHCIDEKEAILSDGIAFCENKETKQPGSEIPTCSSPPTSDAPGILIPDLPIVPEF